MILVDNRIPFVDIWTCGMCGAPFHSNGKRTLCWKHEELMPRSGNILTEVSKEVIVRPDGFKIILGD